MKIWFKVLKNTHILQTETLEDYTDDTRTHKIFHILDEACHRLDLGRPIWLESNINEFAKRGKTRFGRENFIEEIPFDYLEMQILEEDY